jgi:HAD superfamily hydrolase (TIGR01509 family)
MNTQYLFWDNDGVLVDTEYLYYQASAEVLAEVNIHLTREQFIDISLQQGQSVFDLARHRYRPDRIDRLRERRNRRYSDLLRQGVPPMAGVTETLQQLHGQVKMAIVTSSQRRHFDLIHRHTELLGFFDFILTREDYTYSKPHPEPYLTALDKSNCAPRHCVVIEDSERGLHAAVAAGLNCVVIPGELNRQSNLTAAAKILKNISDLPEVIFGW